MATISEYVRWRADVPLWVDPFNEVDNLVLSKLVYSRLDGIVPPDGEEVTLVDACEAYFKTHSDASKDKEKLSLPCRAAMLMPDMVQGERFKNIRLSHYVNEVDRKKDSQFAAVCARLEDGTLYVAFRGTDASFVGWKEDFNFCYVPQTEGQRKAVDYLNTVGENEKSLRVGGHSKGGNFAVYASAFCRPSVQEKIRLIYTNDGPGFREEIVSREGYANILPKIVSIVPDTAVIGLLLSGGYSHKVVKSCAAGFLQHNGFSWEVERNHFVETELSRTGELIEEALDTWIQGIDDKTRKSMISSVFSLFEATGMESFTRMNEQKWKAAEAILLSLQELPKEKRKELSELFRRLLQSGGHAFSTRNKQIKETKS